MSQASARLTPAERLLMVRRLRRGYLRTEHLEQLASILADPEASGNDVFVADELLLSANIAAAGVLPMCQDTDTVVVMANECPRGHFRRRSVLATLVWRVLPWVDEINAHVLQVFDVARCHRHAARPGDGCNLGICLGSCPTGCSSLRSNGRVGTCRGTVEGENVIREILTKHQINCRSQHFPATTRGQNRYSIAKLRLADRRHEQRRCIAVSHPGRNGWIRSLSHQLRNDVGVENNQLCRSIETRWFRHWCTLQNLQFDPTQRRESVAECRCEIC